MVAAPGGRGNVTPENPFADFLRRIRAGDARAAEELVRRYETTIRVAVRARLTDPVLQRHFDSMDVCQSVLASFFVRAAAGQFDLAAPGELVGLLVRMAQHKLAGQVRFHRRERRDARRAAEGAAVLDVLAKGDEPDRAVAGQELLAAVRAGLTAEERELADRRADGQEWAEIAAALGGTAEGRRKQLARALDRMANRLGIDE
jgi:RNA polymerase sigma-70 factor (ECF subfamily)